MLGGIRSRNTRPREMASMSVLHASSVRPSPIGRWLAFVAIGTAVAVLIGVVLWGAVFRQAGALAAGLEPGFQDGRILSAASLDDARLPAIANLDPQLASAMREAAGAAASDGIRFEVTSGWRTPRYQQWLLEEAIRTYGSEEAALQWVAAPDRSHHVTGGAIDIGPLDAQSWLIEHGATWGLCQIYANERWHFERATEPGGSCPAPREDAAG